MATAWERRVRRVQDHVRHNVTGQLDLDSLADVAGASRFHFARLFKAQTGETLNGFVRRARLERAVVLMRAKPERPLLDVALESGFASASDFSRVFRQHHGIAPSAWDRVSVLTDKLEGFDDGLAAARATSPVFEPIVRRHEGCRLAYVRVSTPFLDDKLLDEGYAALTGWFEERGVDWRALGLIGMSWDRPETTPLEQVRFDLGFPLPDGLSAAGPVSEVTLPAMRSVEIHVDDELVYVALAWEHLYEEWFPGSGEEPADLPAMKRFRRRPEELGWHRVDLDCCIALS